MWREKVRARNQNFLNPFRSLSELGRSEVTASAKIIAKSCWCRATSRRIRGFALTIGCSGYLIERLGAMAGLREATKAHPVPRMPSL